MVECKDFIEYLNSVINNISIRKEENKLEFEKIKEYLLRIVELIENHKISKINTKILEDALTGLIDDKEKNEIIQKLLEIVEMQDYIFDDGFENPIKSIILSDLDSIKNNLVSITEKEVEPELDEESKRVIEEANKYLSLVSETGFTKVLSKEERLAFYDYVKNSNYNGKARIIGEYVIYATKQKNKINITNRTIEKVNENADAVVEELKNNIEKEETKEEIEEPEVVLINQEELENNETYKSISKLLKEHKYAALRSEEYHIHEELLREYEDNIEELFQQKSSFQNIEGKIDWNYMVAYITLLMRKINSKYQPQILETFEEIVQLDILEKQLIKEEQKRKEQFKKSYKQEMAAIRERLESLREEYDTLDSAIEDATNTIESKLNQEEKEYLDIQLQSIKDLDEEDPKIKAILDAFDISYDVLSTYHYGKDIKGNIEELYEYLILDLTEEDIDELKEKIEETQRIIDTCIIENNPIEEIKEENATATVPQYMCGNSVIVFFKTKGSKIALVEQEIRDRFKKISDKSLDDIQDILTRTNNTSDWSLVVNGDDRFKQPIHYTNASGKQGPEVTLRSGYDPKKIYTYYRLKDKGTTNTRLSMFDINMCYENREKLMIPKNKNVIVFISEIEVHQFSNESSEYSDFTSQFDKIDGEIRDFIKLFEDPETPTEKLMEILNESSKCYERLLRLEKKGVKKIGK